MKIFSRLRSTLKGMEFNYFIFLQFVVVITVFLVSCRFLLFGSSALSAATSPPTSTPVRINAFFNTPQPTKTPTPTSTPFLITFSKGCYSLRYPIAGGEWVARYLNNSTIVPGGYWQDELSRIWIYSENQWFGVVCFHDFDYLLLPVRSPGALPLATPTGTATASPTFTPTVTVPTLTPSFERQLTIIINPTITPTFALPSPTPSPSPTASLFQVELFPDNVLLSDWCIRVEGVPYVRVDSISYEKSNGGVHLSRGVLGYAGVFVGTGIYEFPYIFNLCGIYKYRGEAANGRP